MPRAKQVVQYRDVRSFIDDVTAHVMAVLPGRSGFRRWWITCRYGTRYAHLVLYGQRGEVEFCHADYGWIDLHSGCVLAPSGQRPGALPSGNLVDIRRDPSRGREAIGDRGIRSADEVPFELAWTLRERYAPETIGADRDKQRERAYRRRLCPTRP